MNVPGVSRPGYLGVREYVGGPEEEGFLAILTPGENIHGSN